MRDWRLAEGYLVHLSQHRFPWLGEVIPVPWLNYTPHKLKTSLPIMFYFTQKTLPVFPKGNEVQIKVLNIGNDNMTIYFPEETVHLVQMSQVSRRNCSFLFHYLIWVMIEFPGADLLSPCINSRRNPEVKLSYYLDLLASLWTVGRLCPQRSPSWGRWE